MYTHKILLSTIALLAPLTSFAYLDFSDSQEIPDWAKQAVDEMAQQDIITGFGDRTFRPDASLNRAEAVTLLLRLKGLDKEEVFGSSQFRDVPKDAWFSDAVIAATKEGWIEGREDGLFYPGDTLNRAEFATLITRAFDLEISDENIPEKTPKDLPTKAWFSPNIFALYGNNLVRNPRKIYYGPSTEVSRAEAAWVFYKISTLPRLMGTSGSTDLSTSTKIDSRRTAIRPRDFNAEKQSYDIQQKVITVKATKNSETPIEIIRGQPWTNVGNIELTNNLEEKTSLQSLELRLRFANNNVGPAENFSGKLSHIQVDRNARFARNGDLLLTDIDLEIEPTETKVIKLLIRPESDRSFYGSAGEASIYIKTASAITFAEFKKQNSNRIASIKSTPMDIEERELSEIRFSPILAE